MNVRTAEVIATGSELLKGRTLNKHGHLLGEVLLAHGVDLTRETVVPDEFDTIRSVVAEACERSNFVFVTGGLGPTDDDCTLAAVAEALAVKIVRNAEADAHMEAYFARTARTPSQAQRDQVLVLDGADVWINAVGIAPGQCLSTKGCFVILLPGPPRELRAIVGEHLEPWLTAQQAGQGIAMSVARIIGLSESAIQSIVRSEFEIPHSVEVSYCARPGSVECRLTGAPEMVAEWAPQLAHRFKDCLLNETGRSTIAELAEMLVREGKTVAVAESCTGGGLGHRFTELPGSSSYFLGGVIAYANEVKIRQLQVPSEELEAMGAVSEDVAKSMARGVRAGLGADIGISVTGVAGPDGGTEEKPVGFFWIGVSTIAGERAQSFQVGGNRAQVRAHAIERALEVLWRTLRGSDRLRA